MKLLATAVEFNAELTRLITGCSWCHVAVAWASVGSKAFKLLVEHSKKIERMVVGTHFFQTDPDFIEAFLTHPGTRFILQKNCERSVFHPKAYLFKMSGDKWEGIVGSPNFTTGGLHTNDEAAVLVSDEDQEAAAFRSGLIHAIEGYWKKAITLTPSDLKAYRETRRKKVPALEEVTGSIEAEPILTCSWQKYYEMLTYNGDRVPDHYSIEGRLQVIRSVQKMFADNAHFKDIATAKRKCIAGTLHYRKGVVDGVNYLWFGSMWGAGMFKGVVKENDPNVSLALDAIQSEGDVTKDAYLAFTERFKKAFPQGRDGLPMATRLLAMKRPDVFVCLDSKNETKLYEDFGISKGIKRKDYVKYWDAIVAPLMASPWWNSPIPTPTVEREVWQARAAFLDCLYYEGVDLPDA